MMEDKILLNLLVISDVINTVCKDIADNKTTTQVNELLLEELSEVIKSLIKLQRWDNGETTLIYEELADVIIMMLQFIYKNNIEREELLNKICKKIIK